MSDDPNWDELVDEILASDYAEEFDDKVGINEYYFSIHSRNMDILQQFEYGKEWIKAHATLRNHLQIIFDDWWEDQPRDAYNYWIFWEWFNGGKIQIDGEAYVETLTETLVTTYQKRITETYQCSKCGRQISQKHGYGDPSSLHRIGRREADADPWEYDLYCHGCWNEETGLKK